MGDTFEEIQGRLAGLWNSLSSFNQDPQTIVVVPSLSFWIPPEIAPKLPAYEERYLFLLFLLRQPRARMVFLTSRPVSPEVVDYYLSLMPGVIPAHARARLHLLSPDDASGEPLTRKILDRPDLIAEIRSLVADPARAHIVPYITSELERDLVVRLGIPMYGADPKYTPLGSKSGGRKLFAEAGVPHPDGAEDLHTPEEIVDAILRLRGRSPGLRGVVVKCNEGVGGFGNAIVDLAGLPDRAAVHEVEARVRAMRIPVGTGEEFLELFAKQGGIVEAFIDGVEVRSPSVQLRGTPLGELEILSTHDQLLGGPEGQTYLGCRFPADRTYAAAIAREAAKVGRLLVERGVLGRFAIDFVVVRSQDGRWEPYAIELNLRKGGTTHPYLTLQFLTDGAYDAPTGRFIAPTGREKFFVATDHAENDAYASLQIDDVFDVLMVNGLQFHQGRQTGIVLHMLSALRFGNLGLTAVADSPGDAQALYERAVAALDAAAARRR